MPPTIDTSRMSVEQMRALSAEKQHERQGKKEKEAREWARCADQLEAALLQGFPATLMTDRCVQSRERKRVRPLAVLSLHLYTCDVFYIF